MLLARDRAKVRYCYVEAMKIVRDENDCFKIIILFRNQGTWLCHI